jgi:hypothetical protein
MVVIFIGDPTHERFWIWAKGKRVYGFKDQRTQTRTRGAMARAGKWLTVNDFVIGGPIHGELDELFDLVPHLALQQFNFLEHDAALDH